MRPLKRNDAIFLIIKEKFAKYAFMIFSPYLLFTLNMIPHLQSYKGDFKWGFVYGGKK